MERLATIVVGYLCVIVLVVMQPGAQSVALVDEPPYPVVAVRHMDLDRPALPNGPVRPQHAAPIAATASVFEGSPQQHRLNLAP